MTGYSSLDEMIHVIHNQGAEYVKTLQKEADRIGTVIKGCKADEVAAAFAGNLSQAVVYALTGSVDA